MTNGAIQKIDGLLEEASLRERALAAQLAGMSPEERAALQDFGGAAKVALKQGLKTGAAMGLGAGAAGAAVGGPAAGALAGGLAGAAGLVGGAAGQALNIRSANQMSDEEIQALAREAKRHYGADWVKKVQAGNSLR